MKIINVMLIEDHNVFREGLKKLIDLEENMQVVAEAGSCLEALKFINNAVDVVLLDINLPDGDGIELSLDIKQSYPSVKFIALTTYDDAIFIKKAIECGIHGFVPKYAFFDEIRSAITMTYKGNSYLYPGLNSSIIMNLSDPGLSDLELSLVQQLASGKSQKEIADGLFISLSTFRRRLRGIFTKFGVTTVEELLTIAAKKGLIK